MQKVSKKKVAGAQKVMKWRDVLDNWTHGEIFKYPKNLERFEWNTSVLKNNGDVNYRESFKINRSLPKAQNMTAFKEHIKNSKNKYVTSFLNLSKDIILIVPMPVAGKNYATLKDFVDNAPKLQQKAFWKKVAKVAEHEMKEKGSVWISAHGLGVPYLHIRIASKPKYYFDTKLAKD